MAEVTEQEIRRLTDPVRVGPLLLPNRMIKAATYEGMSPGGMCTNELTAFHSKMIRGGVGMTTVAYASISPDGRTHEDQLLISEANEANLCNLTSEIHKLGGLVSIQITHCGYFTRNRNLKTRSPGSASRNFNSYGALMGLPYSHAMTIDEMNSVCQAFANAAARVVKCGFDAIELHMGHGYLLSQFISPSTNRRKDAFGGSTENRFRFPAQVLAEVKRVAGDVPVIVKMNASDGFKGGLQPEEASAVALLIQDHGADAIITSGGFTSKSPFFLMRGNVPWSGMIRVEPNLLQKTAIATFGPFIMKAFPFTENYFAHMASKASNGLTIPVFYSGGAVSSRGIARLLEQGFSGVAIGRALIHNSNLLRSLDSDPDHVSACNHCNQCMVEMDNGGVKCVL